MLQLLAQNRVETKIAQEVSALNFFQQDIGVFVTRLVEVAIIGGAILLLVFLIWGGIDWIGSSGDKAKYEAARNKITHALLGMAILASVWALWQLANYFLGINKVFSGSSTVSTGASGDCWPFTSCQEWRDAFATQHSGQQPTDEDFAAFQESANHARRSNQSLTPTDWERRYYEGRWPD